MLSASSKSNPPSDFMTDEIVLKQLIRFVGMISTTAELGKIGIGSVAKATGTIVKTDENNARCLICTFFKAEARRMVLSMLRCS